MIGGRESTSGRSDLVDQELHQVEHHDQELHQVEHHDQELHQVEHHDQELHQVERVTDCQDKRKNRSTWS